MARLPMMTSREVIAILRRAGWVIDRQKGSHVVLARPDGTRPVVVPSGALEGILDQADLTADEFLSFR